LGRGLCNWDKLRYPLVEPGVAVSTLPASSSAMVRRLACRRGDAASSTVSIPVRVRLNAASMPGVPLSALGHPGEEGFLKMAGLSGRILVIRGAHVILLRSGRWAKACALV
jgi:hypothetical protein